MSEPSAAPPSTAPHEPDPPLAEPVRRRGRTALISALIVGVVLAGLMVVFARRMLEGQAEAASPLIGRPAPELVGETIDGTPYRGLDRERGRWVVVNFFATWCVPCREEHDDLVRFAERHRATGDATVVAVTYSDPAEQVRAFRAANGGTWPMVTDPEGSIAVRYGVTGVPESFLIAPDGTVAVKLIGGVRDADLEALLTRLTTGTAER